MEHGFADEPEEAVHARPELADVTERLGAVPEEVDGIDAVPEAEDEATYDDCGNERCEDLGDGTHGLLEQVLVLEPFLFDVLLRALLDSTERDEILEEHRYVVSDDDLELSGLCEATLHARKILDGLDVRLLWVVQREAHARHAVGYRGDVLPASHQS